MPKFSSVSKNVLKIEYDYDFLLTALASPVKDYHLCWHLNHHLGLQLEKKDDLEINDKKKHKLSWYSTYEYYDELNNYLHIMVSNKCSGEWLIPELKQADYFLIGKENCHLLDHDEFIGKIKKIPVVQTAFAVDPQELRSKQNLLF